jgi:hypothetical protein
MGSPTLAEQLVDVIRQVGVERVYGVVGDSLNPGVDAIRRADEIARIGLGGGVGEMRELARANLRNIRLHVR